jgi:hypothetical protein
MAKRNKGEKQLVCAYGFDKLGFAGPTDKSTATWEAEHAKVVWLPYGDHRPFEEFDGVIMPQGIFEEIKIRNNTVFGDPYGTVNCDRDLMLEKDRQMRNLTNAGGWICFLVGEIVESVPDGSGYGTRPVRETDLCRRALEGLDIEYQNEPRGLTGLSAIQNEFIKYVEEHGVAKTLLIPRRNKHAKVLVELTEDHPVGVEVFARFFFLPFLTTRKDFQHAKNVGSLAAESVIAYRRKVNEEAPQWVNELRFEEEIKLLEHVDQLQEKLDATKGELDKWCKYKRILVRSGDPLKDDVVAILTEYFGLKVDSIDAGREDFKILASESVVCLGEVKGTNSGVKREHVNQVDSHRERNDLDIQTAGLLVINNQMDIASIEERLKTTVPEEQIVHARSMNVLIVRTVDLLFFMRHVEGDSDRSEKLLRVLSDGGGWLSADTQGYRIVNSLS